MSNFDFKKLRQQSRATGVMLQETFKASDIQLEAFAKRDADPTIAKAQQEKGKQLKDLRGQSWKNNHGQAMTKLAKDTNWQEAQQKGSLLRSQKESWKENHTKSMEQLCKNEQWLENKAKGKMVPVITPFGIFPSSRHAGDEYNKLRGVTNGKNAVYNNLKKGAEGYKLISREEYIMLTGKDI